MPKIKNHSGASKRFKVSGTGKYRRFGAYGSHILTKKSSRRKRNYRQSKTCHPSLAKEMKSLLPYT